MKKNLLFILILLSSSPLIWAQNTQHFAKQLLNLEKELEVFRGKIDEKERQIRTKLSQKSSKFYALKQKTKKLL